MPDTFAIEPLGPHHDRRAFSCGKPAPDDFIKTKARKETALGYCAVFVLIARSDPNAIGGYYSLSAHTIVLDGIAAAVRGKLPKYPLVPTTRIGRLARDLRFHGQGAGRLLLIDALQRAWRNAAQIGAYAVTVDAIHGEAASFYAKYGFVPLIAQPGRLYLPMALIARLGL